ncbi:MAG: hypothetical protein HY782_19580 [Chloroflexi bacterium]|nr:hypothetical protein [Chloroflexota bacterium]
MANDPFRQAEDQYFILRGKLGTSRLSREQFEAALRDLMIEDTQGRHWLPGVDSGRWHVYDGQAWVEADPYAAGVVGKLVAPSQPQIPQRQVPPPPPVVAPQRQVVGDAGSSVAHAPPPPPVVAPQPKKGLGCIRIGCIGVLLIACALIALGAGLYFQIPQRVGLLPSAERTFASTPDREAATALRDELNKGGIDTKGMGIYVLPFRDKPGSVAYIVLDSAQGFKFKSGSKDPIIDYFKQMAQSEATKKYGLQRLAMEYKSPTGTTLLSLTASTDVINGFISGKVSRSDFLKQVDGQANWVGFYQEVLK